MSRGVEELSVEDERKDAGASSEEEEERQGRERESCAAVSTAVKEMCGCFEDVRCNCESEVAEYYRNARGEWTESEDEEK